jgi:hypothetical protein
MAQIKKDIRYLNKDFSQFRANLIEFAKNYFPNTYNDFNESSPGTMIIEMASYVGDVLSYYTDNQLKESLLPYATNGTSILAIASTLGYRTKNTIPATVDLDVFQLLPAKTTESGKTPDWSYALTIKEGMIARADDQNIEFRTASRVNFASSSSLDPTEVSVYQVNDLDGTPEYYLLRKTVKAVSGTVKTVTYEFGNAKRFDKILLNDINIIDVVSIIDSDLNEWTEVPYLGQETVFETVANTVQNDPQLSSYKDVPYLLKLKKTAKRFITRFRPDKNLEIQFGPGVSVDSDEEIIPNPDNIGNSLVGLQMQYDQPIDPSNFMYTKAYGQAPSNTILTVKYTIGGGVESNVPSFAIKTVANVAYEIDSQNLDARLLTRIKASVACTNPKPASGGKSSETIEEIRQNALSSFASQQRAVTAQDYVIRAYSLPSKFGSVAKAFIIQDEQINPNNTEQRISNPLALNLYTLGYDSNGKLAELNPAVKENLKTYLSQYRMVTDAINIKTAFIINIGVQFEIVTLPEYNSNEVLLKCIDKLKTIFNIRNWQINQPIILSKIYTELDRVEGVQSVTTIKIGNLYDTATGYSGNVYDITSATKDGVIYPSLDPSIFEVKFPNSDIIGKVNAM